MLSWLEAWPNTPGAAFVLSAVAGILVPLPEDIVLMYIGLRSAMSSDPWVPILVAATLGTVCRDLMVYAVGRRLGDWLFERPKVRRMLGERRLDRARHLFETRGTEAVLIGRFLVGMRIPFFAVAGAMRCPLRVFLFWDFLGALLTVPLLMLLGARFGEAFITTLFAIFRAGGPVLWGVLFLGGTGWWWWKRRTRAALDEPGVPVEDP
jgi:membrane protein DedA with SNARE-associated domain